MYCFLYRGIYILEHTHTYTQYTIHDTRYTMNKHKKPMPTNTQTCTHTPVFSAHVPVKNAIIMSAKKTTSMKRLNKNKVETCTPPPAGGSTKLASKGVTKHT